MAMCIYFPLQGMSPDVYDEVIRRLEAAGAGMPPGRSFHCAFTAPDGSGGLQVVDCWDSQEDFDRFGETLMPILSELGVDPGQPAVGEIHNTILG